MDDPALADLPASTRAAVLTLAGLSGFGFLCAAGLVFAIVAVAHLRSSGAPVPDGAAPALYRFAIGAAAFACCRGALASMIVRRSAIGRRLATFVEAAAIALGLLSWYGGPGYEGPRAGATVITADVASWFGATVGIAVSIALVLLLWTRRSEAWCDR